MEMISESEYSTSLNTDSLGFTSMVCKFSQRVHAVDGAAHPSNNSVLVIRQEGGHAVRAIFFSETLECRAHCALRVSIPREETDSVHNERQTDGFDSIHKKR